MKSSALIVRQGSAELGLLHWVSGSHEAARHDNVSRLARAHS
ncbi:MAG: hypothetical protein JWN13_2419 [Betaproteobacteria bacterium]|jgi:hypothetical protein|nr:hypothetical protein [Betaproteobacteria bacterium]MEA3156675.1 hypothetical protein [Betaproteobacteria bacterium]